MDDLLKALRDLTKANHQQALAVKEQAYAISQLALSNHALIEALQQATQESIDAQVAMRDMEAQQQEEQEDADQFEFLEQTSRKPRAN